MNGHSLWSTFWEVVDNLQICELSVNGPILDGSSNNHQLTRIVVDPAIARIDKYTNNNLFHLSDSISINEDCKKVFKEINSLLSSSPFGKWQLTLNGQCIYWSFFQECYEFNLTTH